MSPTFAWPQSYHAAVSLTFDDGLPCHTQIVAPLLESKELTATFYVPILSDVRLHPQNWQRMAASGHELGNHTVFHPCRGEPEFKRAWLEPGYNLLGYTPRRWCDEVDAASFTLSLLDGQTERTFGNTCFDNTIGAGETLNSLEPLIAQRFLAARGEHTKKPIQPSQANLMNLGTFDIDGFSADQAIELIETAFQYNQWLIFTMHGVGANTHHLNITEVELVRLVEYLFSHRQSIWTAPLITIAKYIRQFRE